MKMPCRSTWPVAALVAAALVAAALAAGCDSAPPPSDQTLEQSGLVGRVTLAQVGAVGDPLSDVGLQQMLRLREDIPELALACVQISSDPQAVDAFAQAAGPGMIIVRDPYGRVADALGAGSVRLPTFILLDRYGHVRYRGALPETRHLIRWTDVLFDEKNDPGEKAEAFGLSPERIRELLAKTALPDLAGKSAPLKSMFGPKGLLVVFVDTNCPFSGEAIVAMKEVSGALGALDVPSVLVNLNEPREKVAELYPGLGLPVPVVYDTTGATQDAWQVDYVPTVMLFDVEGRMIFRGRAIWADVAAVAQAAFGSADKPVNINVKGTGFG
jgi:hypothetical protein